ncbi:MAG TPA: helix-turn-helix domain-containing protein [Actinomycetota bacterium]
MLTVPEAARRVGRDPETVRRWIRSGKLRSQRVGTQHLVDERELDALAATWQTATLPPGWRRMASGEPMPDVVRLVREAREGR